MIVQNNDGRPASVYVPDGESFTIAQQGAREQGIQVLAVRPKTTLALKAVLGLDTVGTARLGDDNAFDVLDKTDDLVQLNFAARDKRIARHPVSFIRGLVDVLDEESPRPARSVKVLLPRQRTAGGDQCGCGPGKSMVSSDAAAGVASSRFLPPSSIVLREQDDVKALTRQFSGSHLFREVSVPQVLRDLSVFALVVSLGDIVVGEQATLTLDDDIFLMRADNVILYTRARVVQRSSTVFLDIGGRMQGDVTVRVHQLTDALIIDHAKLDRQLLVANQ